MDQMIKIQKTLGPFDSTGISFDRAKISKEEELQNRIIQLEKELSRKQALDSEVERLSGSLDVIGKWKMEIMKLEEYLKDVETLNRSLIAREYGSNDQYIMESESTIGIKRMGELNPEPFLDECKKKFAVDDWCLKSEQLFSLWQQHIRSPLWHPFKRILLQNHFETHQGFYRRKPLWNDLLRFGFIGNFQHGHISNQCSFTFFFCVNQLIVDEDNEGLKELRNE
ncbi:XH/XS domain-containing protein isoform 5 [Gossypium australe]|uniref:XH/XS domain-containing protein isoform 5 n=1 Tax=Gossypium australe TaxID=47621 RepID=A0A5B6WKC6_9ROSI|nr:XH/XS domain-containing protein isoform 5 [Gossypium australe]